MRASNRRRVCASCSPSTSSSGPTLAFRSDHGAGGKVAADWRPVFLEFSDRFMVGTDTFTPERLFYVPEHATWSRAWLADLPPDVAERIAWKNGEALFGGALGKRP